MNSVILKGKIWNVFFVWRIVYIIDKNKKRVMSKFDYKNIYDISIVATNCISGELYSILGLKFSSPFINTSLDRHDFTGIRIN